MNENKTLEKVEKFELAALVYKTRALRAEQVNLINQFNQNNSKLAELEEEQTKIINVLFSKYNFPLEEYTINVDSGEFQEVKKGSNNGNKNI